MNKLIIFDLDGVLYDSKEIHFESLNQALLEVDEKYIISLQDHLNIFDGLPTKTKLRMISDKKDLPEKLHEMIWQSKQEKTLALIKNISNDDELIEIFSTLKNLNIRLHVARTALKVL